MHKILEKLLSLRDDTLYVAVYGMTREQLGKYFTKHCCDAHKVPDMVLGIKHAEKLNKQLDTEDLSYREGEVIENILEFLDRLIETCHIEEEEAMVKSSNPTTIAMLKDK